MLSPCFHQELVSDVGSSYFSLLIDESTDIACAKNLCLAIRYYSSNKKLITSTFYRLIQMAGSDAEDMSEAVLYALSQDNLSVRKLMGIGTDGANVMVGSHNSVFTRLKELQQDLILVKCLCHSLALAVSKAVEILPKQLEYVTREIYNWFGSSESRKRKYADLYSSLTGKLPLKILRLCETRWLSRDSCVERIMSQWNELVAHFRSLKETEREYVVDQLFSMLSDPFLRLYFVFLKPILKQFSQVNALFQSKSAAQLHLYGELMLFYKSLLKRVCPIGSFVHLSDAELLNFSFRNHVLPTSGVNYGAEFTILLSTLPYSQLPASDIDYVKERCRSFLVEALAQVQMRIPDNVRLFAMLDMLSPGNAASGANKGSIAELLAHFSHLNFPVGDIDTQWFTVNLIDWSAIAGRNNFSAEEFWSMVYEYKDSVGRRMFLELGNFALALLSLPLSNADVERVFSQQNIIKSKLRSRLGVSTVESILSVRYGLKMRGESCVNFMPSPDMFKLFNNGMYAAKCDSADCEELAFESDDDDYGLY